MFKRGKIWYFSINGVKESSGTTDRRRAEAQERKRRQEEWDKLNGFHIKTWDEACLDWLETHKHLASYRQNKNFAKWWTPHLTGLKVTAITKELINRLITTHRKVDPAQHTKANATGNTYVAFAEKICRSAGCSAKFIRYPEPVGGKRWLRREEWDVLAPLMDADLRHIATFALATGLREMNCITFEWTWIHGTSAYLPGRLTKTREDYGIPLSSVAQAVIEERRQAKVRHPNLVFTYRGKPWTCNKLLQRLRIAVKRAEIDYMTFHTLRHTFASWLAQRGVSDAVRKRLGCWSAGTDAASGYVHFDVESLRPFSEMVFPKESHPVHQVVEQSAKTA